MDEPTFKLYFNKKRQWILVFLWDVHPTTFSNWKMGRWGCFNPRWENPKVGYFGDVHLVASRVREDLVVHELDHVRWEWLWANRVSVQSNNEEKYTAFLDNMVGSFYREYRKIK